MRRLRSGFRSAPRRGRRRARSNSIPAHVELLEHRLLLAAPEFLSPNVFGVNPTATIEWTDVGAAQYELHLYEDGVQIVVEFIDGTSFVPVDPLSESSLYAVQVRPADGTDADWTAPLRFTVNPDAPGPLQVDDPAFSTDDPAAPPVITWSDVPDANHYEIDIYHVPSGEEVVREDAVDEARFEPDWWWRHDGEYAAYVRAVTADGLRGSWRKLSFNIDGDEDPLTVTDGLSDGQVELSWSEIAGAATHDVLIYDLDAGMEVRREDGLDGTTFAPGLGPGRFQAFVNGVSETGVAGVRSVHVFDGFQLTADVDRTAGDVAPSSGTLVTQSETVTVVGMTNAGATVEIDRDGDGAFDDGSVVADSAGSFSIDVTLVHNDENLGANTLQVRSTLPGTELRPSDSINVHFAVGTVVRFASSAGNVDVELFDEAAPVTVANFRGYFERYANSIVHRSVSGFVIQGGGFTFDEAADPQIERVPTDPPIANEFDPQNSNLRGTLSMALVGGDADSGTSQWFFNLVDNLRLDGDRHTVFGRVIGTGMEVVDAIAAMQTVNLNGVYPQTALGTVPLTGYERFTQALSGTVSVTAASNVVTGSGTSFIAGVQESAGNVPGSAILIAGEEFVVGEIVSDSELTLKDPALPTVDKNHVAGADDVPAFVNSPPDEAEFVVFQQIDELFGP